MTGPTFEPSFPDRADRDLCIRRPKGGAAEVG
jgi:hypothetical protein